MKRAVKAAETMTCNECRVKCQRFGKHRNGLRRFRCPECKRTFTEPHELTLGEMYAPQQKVLFALNLLLEGNSIRSTMRLTDLDQNTIMKALVLAGERCERVMARYVVRVPVRDVQVDEIWSFIGKKQKAVTIDDDPNLGDAYCFTAIEKNSKLILNFALGKRNQRTTDLFIEGLRHATVSQHFQITTDGFGPYRTAIPDTLGDRCDLLNSSKSTQLRVKGKPAILPPKSFPRRWSQLSAIPIRSVFARPTLSGKTSA